MAVNAPHENELREPLQFSVELEQEGVQALEKLVAESDTNSLEALLQALLVAGLTALADKLSNASEREQMDALLREAKVELHVVERAAETRADNYTPTLDELLAMPLPERRAYMERAAHLLEAEYRTNPELTITADATDLYDYPED